MTMKRTDLEKLKGKKIEVALGQSGSSHRFGPGAAQVVDRKEQRKRDQALGLIPFAVKLDGDLVKAMHSLAQERKVPLNDLVAELLRKGLQTN